MENLKKNINLFCIFKEGTNQEELGIAGSTFASEAWKKYKSASGRSFNWIDSNGDIFSDDKKFFTRPTVEYVKENISVTLQVYFESITLKKEII